MEQERIPIIGEAAGPQIVVLRKTATGEELVFRENNFERAGDMWREGKQQIQEGGYCLWINDGDLWRMSGLLLDQERARAIRDRVCRR